MSDAVISQIMMALGDYRFSLGTAAYQRCRRETEFGWTAQPRLGREPAMQQSTGTKDQITLSGTVLPTYKGGLGQIQAMRREAGKGVPLDLVDGMGFVLGRWVIQRISEEQTEFFSDGAPKKQDFTLALAKYGEDQT